MSLSLTEALAAAAAEQPSQARLVETLLASLPKGEAAALVSAMESQMSAKRIAAAMTAAGYPMGRGAIEGWRNRNAAR
jgi:prolyl-tRNA editing enzyme YbaK/EbsC (Cys-tRNA(Pro) deacylase)